MDYNKFFIDVNDMEKILNQYEPEMLRKLCSFLIQQYVLNHGVGYDTGLDDMNMSNSPVSQVKEIGSFPELIKNMQQKYNFPELQKFSVESDKVYITVDGKKLPISPSHDTGNTITQSIRKESLAVDKKNDKPDIKGPDETQSRFKNIEMD